MSGAWGSTRIVEGKLEVAPGGEVVVLRVGDVAVPIAASRKTRFWAKRAVAADFRAFHVGVPVVARLDPDRSPALLKELADKESWTWLEGIRKEVRDGIAKSFERGYLTIAFDDGSEMAYHATAKTEITLDGKPASLSDLRSGQRLWLRGRTLATLDLVAVTISDRAPVVLPKKTTEKKRGSVGTPPKLAASGTLTGKIATLYPDQGMFDLLIDGSRFHVSYVAATEFTLNGTKCGSTGLVPDREASVAYRRDAYGRIVAAKVEIR